MCVSPGLTKNTYGTGCFMLQNTGAKAPLSRHKLLRTAAWKRGGLTEYALEGSVFIGGAVVQWLRDGLGMIRSSAEAEALAASVPDNGGVYLVPAFAGLGAPHWDAYARGAIVGLTRGSTGGHIARAALEAIAYQSADLLDAMQADAGVPLAELRVDGGASLNNLLMQFQSDLIGVPVVGLELHQRSEEHTSELQSHSDLVCRLLLDKKKRVQAVEAGEDESLAFCPAFGVFVYYVKVIWWMITLQGSK